MRTMLGNSLHYEALQSLWRSLDLPGAELLRVRFTGDPDRAINSSFRLGVAAQAAIGLSGLSAAYLYELRTGKQQDVTVDARHAVLAFHGEAFYTRDGRLPGDGARIWDSIAGLYETKDGYARLHTNFPHHRRGLLDILKVPDAPTVSMQQVQAALSQWSSIDFETEAASYGMCANALRSFNEWDNHPHAKAMASVPPIRLIRIGDAPKRTDTDTKSRPLDGIRILDLSRVLAGPIASRTLAAHGADVLLVTSPNLPSLPLLDAETSLGKRTTQLDLTSVHDRKKLEDLIRDADVFLQAYRPGGLQSKGFGPEELAKIRPGIVSANLTAWGWDGPWKDRRGFDSLVQTATGLNVAEGEAYAHYQQLHGNSSDPKPRPLPMQALDHAAGYLLASGVNAALCKTIIEGGSWEVQVSLLGVGNWIRSLGRLDPEMAFGHGQPFPPIQIPPHPEVMGLSVPWTRGHGSTLKSASTSGEGEAEVMTSLKHAAILSGTPVREGPDSWAPLVLNAHQAEWLPRD